MIDSTSNIEKTGGFIEREIGDELIFFAESGAEIHTVDGTALFIYKCIDGTTPVSAIVARVCDEYEIDGKAAETDTISFLAQLLEKEIIKKTG